MRLLDTRSLRFLEVNDPKAFKYALLSHTWDLLGEQSFQELVEIQRTHPGDTISASPALSSKIRDFCAFARNAGYDYCWIDSCCIDKTSSSELTESINSMYAWYGVADVCYVYLADVGNSPGTWEGEFRKSRWHQRAWTLQELIAPKNLIFLSRDWSALGSKAALAALVENVTGISAAVLMLEEPLSCVSVARRMSWAASRESTRAEDRAYSLFGIFNVRLPSIYGEGEESAFVRLQEEILRHIPDQSIFAWGLQPVPYSAAFRVLRRREGSTYAVTRQHGLLASSPRDFQGSQNVQRVPDAEFRATLRLTSNNLPSLDLTAYAIPFNSPVYPVQAYSMNMPTHVAVLACKDPARGLVSLLIWDRSDSNSLLNDFSLGESMWDPMYRGHHHGTYIMNKHTIVIRADAVLSELQSQWGYTSNMLLASSAAAILVVAGALGSRMEGIFTEPATHTLCAAFVSVDVVGLGVSYCLRFVVFKSERRNLTTFCDDDLNERISFFLLRQVPALCLVILATALIVCQCLVATLTLDTGDPLLALCVLMLVIALGVASRMVLFQSMHTVHDALRPLNTV